MGHHLAKDYAKAISILSEFEKTEVYKSIIPIFFFLLNSSSFL